MSTPTEIKEVMVDTFGWLIRLVFAVAAISLFYLIMSSVVANATECQSRAGDTSESRWTWRMVDGRKCWYKGSRRLPKSSLHWSKQKKEKMDPKLPAKQVDPPHRAKYIDKNGTTIVDPRDFNEIDALAPKSSGPIIMFPELSDKVDALTRWWNNRWNP
jgi:hypothetical protein